MCIALIGGIGGATRDYEKIALEYGVTLRHFEKVCPRFEQKLYSMDAIIVFTSIVSHLARTRALSSGKKTSVPVLMCHSCGMSSLRRCIDTIVREKQDKRRIQ